MPLFTFPSLPPLPPHGTPSHLLLLTRFLILVPLHIALFPLHPPLPHHLLLPLTILSLLYLLLSTILYLLSTLPVLLSVACDIALCSAWAVTAGVLLTVDGGQGTTVGIIGCVVTGGWAGSAAGMAGVWWRLRAQKREEDMLEEGREKGPEDVERRGSSSSSASGSSVPDADAQPERERESV